MQDLNAKRKVPEERPFVVIQVAATVDGKISSGPNRTMWEDMGNPDPDETETWSEVASYLKSMHRPQADMLGSNSLVKEDEELILLPAFQGDRDSLYQDYLPDEIVNLPGREGWLVVVDGRGRVRGGYKGENNWYMLHLVSHRVEPEYLAFLRRESIPYLITGEDQVDLAAALGKMKAKLGVDSLMCTAGGRLGGALLRQGLIDEINIIFQPRINGGFNTPALFAAPDLEMDEKLTDITLLSAQVRKGSLLWLRYQVK